MLDNILNNPEFQAGNLPNLSLLYACARILGFGVLVSYVVKVIKNKLNK